MVATTMQLSHTYDERAGSYLACAASILTLALAGWTGLRFFGGWTAIAALLFLAVFKADLVSASRCWVDPVAGLGGFLMIYGTLEI
jgi:hypothetical protein